MALIGKIEEYNENDSWIEYTERLEQYFAAKEITENSKKRAVLLSVFFSRKNELSVHDGCLLWGNRVVIPPKERARLVKELHETHPGICRMKTLARGYVWWSKMDSDVEQKLHQCSPCQENKVTGRSSFTSVGMAS